MDYYSGLTLRNRGYLDAELQERVRNCRILIAGCGIGSQIAVAATRLGFERFTLVDGDRIELHNLNRQAFDFDQVGALKVSALAEQIKRINPGASLSIHDVNVTADNVSALVDVNDVVIDTIDFLDMEALFSLHDAAFAQRKAAFSAFAVGWGAAAMYFANQREGDERRNGFREVFSHRQDENVDPMSYVQRFKKLFELMAPHLNPTVVRVMVDTFQSMMDGRPCPAPQVAVGAQAVSAMLVTMLIRHLAGEELPTAPNLLMFDLWKMTDAPLLSIANL